MKPIVNELLSTKVMLAVKAAIVSGELAPGIKTTETQIATILGVSRTPVREALRQLNAEGFVTLIKNSGVIIADFTLEDTLSILQVRGVLEGLATRLAATQATAEQIAHLRSVHSMVQNLNESHTGEEFMRADRTFHDSIIKISGNPHIAQLTESIKGRLMRLHTLLIELSGGKILDHVREQHGAILDAIAAGEAEKAEYLSRQHMGLMGHHVEAMVAKRRSAAEGEKRLSWNTLDADDRC